MQRSKTPPKGAAIFVATCLTREPALINDYHAAAVTTDLLGIEGDSTLVKLAKDLPPTGDGRAQVITLGVVLGALESRTPKDAWRLLGGRRGSHPPAPADPGVTISRHRALVILSTRNRTPMPSGRRAGGTGW